MSGKTAVHIVHVLAMLFNFLQKELPTDFSFIKFRGASIVVITSSTKNKSVGNIIYLHFTVNASQHLLTDAPQLKKQQK